MLRATEDDQRAALAGLIASGAAALDELWLDYFALGGDRGELEVDAFLAGVMAFPADQRDLLAHAANERIEEKAGPAPVPYSRTIRDPLPADGPLAALVRLMDDSRAAAPDRLPEATAEAGKALGVGAAIYLADYQQHELVPLSPAGQEPRVPMGVDTTLAGWAYRQVEDVISRDDDRLWVPIVDGTERLGVLEVTAADPAELPDPNLREQCRWLAGLVGHLVTIVGDYGDALDAPRRRHPRSAAAELVWSLLPPLTATTEAFTVAGALEPSYTVGGDTFDYSLSDTTATLAVFDAMGHGLAAGLLSAVALAASRAARRNGAALAECAAAIEDAIAAHANGEQFITGILADLDLNSGRLRYLAAGHPAPLVLRGGRVVTALSGGRCLPFGLGGEQTIAETGLQPGDWLALHTDGVTEARDSAGAFFGLPRLTDILERQAASGQPPAETLRRLIHSVLAHQAGELQDDATIVLAHWHPTAEKEAPGGPPSFSTSLDPA